MLGIILSISVAFLKALSELAGKVFTNPSNKNSLDENLLSFGVRAIVVVPAFLICLYIGLNLDIRSSFGLIILGALGNAITTVTALKAVKYGDLSIVGPLGSFTIPLLLVSGYFITGELPNFWGLLGVLIIFIGTYFLGFSGNITNIFNPLKNIYSDLGARYMFLTTTIWSLTTPIDKLGVEAMGVYHWLLYLNIFATIFLGIYVIVFQKNTKISGSLNFKNFIKVGAIAFFLGLGNILQLLALKYTLIVYVISIKRASGIFSVLFGFFIFKEKNILFKILAATLMIIGVACIVIGGNI